ncbi:hypothetical protein HK103_006172 [Boothiomyces macroporosus]|uniref:Uncharacterized protein n=1 Tax=Boothiomyces macroporosus TaxID=261099 RepID=A0AAD5Y4V1_9FUNG|nr:hypothetical protein HK103_006172 [Boothiomyces macroporosus]
MENSSNNMQTAMAATTASNLGVTSAAPLTTDASQANSPMDMSSHADNQPTMTMVYSTPVATPDAPMIYNTPVAMTPQVPMVYQTSTSTNAPVVNSGIKSTFSLALLMIAAL